MVNAEIILYEPNNDLFIQSITDSILKEWVVLNDHLEQKLGNWPKLVEKWSLCNGNNTPMRNLTLPILVARNVLSSFHSSNREKANNICKLWASTLINSKTIAINSGWKFHITNSNPSYEKEISAYKQPGVPDGTSINKSVELSDLELQIKDSINLIVKASLRSEIAVQNGMTTFIPLNLPESMEEGLCISFTARNAPGAIFVSMTPIILLAESIIHESVHNIVYNASRLIEFVKNDSDALVNSPLRKDKRPIYGVLHQSIVLHYLVEFYNEIMHYTDHDNIQRNINAIKKREKELRSDLSMSIDILSKNKSELLDEGKSLLNLMKKTMYDSSN